MIGIDAGTGKNHLHAFQKKLTADDLVDLQQGNALNLSRYACDSFDIVLLMERLYLLKEQEDQRRCVERRVSKT